MTKILLTGATGYVGGRLLHRLKSRNDSIRILARNPNRLRPDELKGVEVVQGDALDAPSVEKALEGIDVAFYLIHSMQAGESFVERDRKAARYFAEAARKQKVKRIIYLGGLGEERDALSPHLKSRHEVGQILRTYGGVVIELRASIVIGSGSLSFEMVRSLTERLPVMITPKWARAQAQPISILDLLDYLTRSIDIDLKESRVFEIGGPTRVSYTGLMKEYAHQRGLKRLMIPVPVLTPTLSGLWLNLITPIYARVGRALINSIEHPTVVKDDSALSFFDMRCRDHQTAIQEALRNEDQEYAFTRWSDALASSPTSPWGGSAFGNRIVDSRELRVSASQEDAFRPIRRLGGDRGWYYASSLWRLRGLIDLIVGGVGLRRGRRDPETLNVGETLDFWRVESYDPPKTVRLRAEMFVPGRAWLQFETEKYEGGTVIRQTAIFDPSGLFGIFYWYALYPLHVLIFRGMLREIGKRAEKGEGER